MIKGINLIPLKIQMSWKRARVKRLFYITVATYVVLLSALYFNVYSAVAAKRGDLTRLEEKRVKIASKSTEYLRLVSVLSGINKDEVDLKKRLDLASGLTRDRVLWSNVLKRLSNDIPGGVWLKSLTTSDTGSGKTGTASKRVRLLGSGITNSAVSDLIFILENSGYFHNVRLVYTQKKGLETGIVYDFEVNAELKKGVDGIYGW